MPIVIRALPAGEPDAAHPDVRVVVVDEPASYPCRRCLTDAAVGDRLLLLPYDPFPGSSPYTGEGPVFVHADGCEPHTPGEGVPNQLRSRLLAVRGYDAGSMMTTSDVVHGALVEDALEDAFSEQTTEFVHVHFARPGCFACRVDRC
jgi:hypothetical protein